MALCNTILCKFIFKLLRSFYTRKKEIKAAFDWAKYRTYLVCKPFPFHLFTAVTKKVITYRSRCGCVCVLLFHFQLRDNEKEPWETRGGARGGGGGEEEKEKEEAAKSFIHDKVNAGGDTKKKEEKNNGKTRRSKISRNAKHCYLRGSSYTRVKRT